MASEHHLCRLFSSSGIGVAVLDRRFHFRYVNRALAQINGLPVQAHRGKTIYQVLGNAASMITPRLDEVFSTGHSIFGFELSAKLARRSEMGNWVENFFPVVDDKGEVNEVGAVVIEIAGEPRGSVSFQPDHILCRAVGAIIQARVLLSNCSRAVTLGSHAITTLGRSLQAEVARQLADLQHALDGRRFRPGGEKCQRRQETLSPRAQEIVRLLPPGADIAGNQTSLVPRAHKHQTCTLEQLSPRGREIVRLLAEGNSNKEIAGVLGISIKTVETHRSKIMHTLHLHSVVHLVHYAFRHGLVRPRL